MEGLDRFCGSPFWDANLTWNTDDPYFTPCFEQTVFVAVPALLMLLLTLLELYWRYCSSPGPWASGPIPSSPLNISKLLLNAVLIVIQLMTLFPIIFLPSDATDDSDGSVEIAYLVDTWAPVLRAITYALALLLLFVAKSRGVRSSGSLFLFWTVSAVLESVVFRSVLHSPPETTLTFILDVVSYICTVSLFLLNCWADVDPAFVPRAEYQPLRGTSDLKNSPEKGASYLSQLLFEWFGSIMWKGWRNPLDQKDLWELNEEDRSAALVPVFAEIWQRKYSRKKKGEEISVLPVMFKTFGAPFMVGSLMKLIPDMMVFVSPFILQLLLGFISNPDEAMWKGYLYTLIMFGSAIVQTIITAQYSHRMYVAGMRVRTVLVNAIYRKALVVSNSTKRGTTLGEIVNLMSVDVQKIMDLVPFVNYLWTSPVQIAVALYFQWGILGPSSLAGFFVLILIQPMNTIIVNKTRVLQVQQMRFKDQRVKLMNEILSGIKVLKLYAWEPSFQQQIENIRAKEIRVLRLAAYLSAGMNFLWMCAPFLISVATFTTYVLIDENNVLDATKAFVSVSIFSVINFSVSLLPTTITFATLAIVSLRRINKFMNSEEIDPDAVSHDNERDPIIIEHGNFTWDEKEESESLFSFGPIAPMPFLKDINLRVPQGSLVAVVGAVGSGKSTLLSALIGETNKLSGRVNTVGTVAYIAQQAWIQNVSLRDNILFGIPFDPTKYDKVVRACALKPDIEMLPGGDKTEIGEKGINLSGGQKQRVAVARAVYSNSDVYLFDDPLSAVDSHVGKHIFEHVLGRTGILKNKTRVLVTHGVAFLPQMDQIVVLKDGQVSEVGTYQQLLDAKGAFAEFLAQHANNEEDNGEEEPPEPEADDGEDEATDLYLKREQLRKKALVTSTSVDMDRRSIQLQLMSTASSKASKGEKNTLIQAETSESAGVKFSIYFTYFKAAGWDLTIGTLVLYALFQGFSVGANMILSEWSELPIVNGTQDITKRDTYLGLYGGLGLMQGVAIGIGSATLALGILKSATGLHHKMLYRILRCPMYFFDTTPVGRIVNRFAKDVDTLDAQFPIILRMCLSGFFQMVSTLTVISYTTPVFVAVVVPIGIIYFLVQKLYVSTSRQLKRLESVTRSPIYSHFGESVVGSPTIRAYRQDERFIQLTEAKVDFNQKSYFPSITSNRWLAVRLETVGNLVIFFAALFAVLGRDTLNSGLVGLSVTYSLQITLALNMVVRWVSELEANLVAVERMKEYMEVPQEAPWELSKRRPPDAWPERGQVEFKGFQSRYREGLDLVLRNVTCEILSGEKIGIVGRTGAGKSSMTLGLFRIVEAAGGSIKIDGIDIASLGLHDVRGRITIIPQDPVLFSGSLRLNLDPFNRHTDADLWRALELAHLKVFVKSVALGLDHEISEGGDNLSVGQRQLVCLARALLRKTKILVLDEATAAVDLETDDLIQRTIRAEFKDATIITIAHRLNTILDSSRVIVLDKGEIREFETPERLLQNKHSIFYSMAKDAGLAQ